ncbi:MAG: FAD:protein FMN transferase [Gammaproteobacteria bacterium]|uniref:FAD:protein FMN transferase n=1 Tax=Rhodoferax sp. TaxID=50421 RepID=UPI0017C8029C|nr:FAD:protein FMN transferase [Rhodoferax sp.]MBU3898803.1 FAD:protein FMN transferase [Gammaproteobacteria bacterium]MBA3057363.1 FAD:protein FMN transferase [Rhodoferax sp.]MBU3998994.1 FAD:protein FMN transferase [Gammaproteobacteria bacterium]MBU4019279.1 FAD:protein FMN transferase [Gammaproteobacteria bacterium]MBU4081843.1 FAD:protein FMN transferase [Gammaproteobacteria bacterium]
MTSHTPDRIQLGRRRLAFALPLLACGLVVPSVQARADVHQTAQILMGTRVDLTLQGNESAALVEAAKAAFTEMNRLADMMSRYRVANALNAINLMAGLQPVPVPPELLRVLLMARQAGQASGGAFDATVGSLRGWDFSPEHPSIPSKQQIAAQLRLVDQKAGLVINEHAGTAYLTQRGMLLDLGGVAKLPILQAGLRQLQSRGVVNAMINGGGDVLAMGRLNGRPWRVGLRDPRQPSQLLGAVSLTQGFVAASGDYERFLMQGGKRLHHILDPKTGYPSTGPHGVTLISEQLELINGLGAALMVAGGDAGRSRVANTPGLDALIVDADSSLWLSPGMAQRLKHA